MKIISQINTQISVTSLLHPNKFAIHKIIEFCTSNHFSTLAYVIKHSEDTKPSLSDNGDIKSENMSSFKQMLSYGIRPVELTYASIFKSCALGLALDQGRQVHADCLKRGMDSDVYVRNTLIHFYASCKKIVDARNVFDEMRWKSLVSWNSIISGFVRVSWFYEAVEYFMDMRRSGVEGDGTTMVVMLSVCADIGNLTMGKCVHTQVIGMGMEVSCKLGTALVNMYAKCGDLSLASLVFDTMHERNVWTWSVMILGLAQHGQARNALSLFKKMKDTRIQPNYVTFLGVICACSHGGCVEDGYRFFEEMKRVYGIKPRLIHYGAMVDVLGRAGCLSEAYNFILNMHVKPDPTVWRTLLSACNVHNHIDFDGVGEKVRRRLLALEPRWSGNLVMLANKYADECKWDDAAQLRKSMRVKGLKKISAESCIELNGRTFRFLSGYDSRAACVNNYLLLDGLSLNMKINNP